jgi:predicted metalloprotease with PDZ domain
MIGVRFETTGKALTKHLGSDVSNCALVVAVMENGPGYMAGIEDFDLVTAVDGKTPATPEAIRDRLKLMTPGDSIVLTIRRGTIIKDYSLVSKAWKHVPLPAELQTPPITRKSSPILQGTPNMPSNTNSNGRPAAAPQQTVAPNS